MSEVLQVIEETTEEVRQSTTGLGSRAIATMFETKKEHFKRAMEHEPTSKGNAQDLPTLMGWQKSHVLEYEPELQDEVRLMMERQGYVSTLSY